MKPVTVFVFAAMILCGLAGLAEADVVYPARLQIDERAPGVYDVVFSLPLVQGRILRATPTLPPSCTDTTQRSSTMSSSGRTTTWSTLCDPASLAGEAVIVDGLFGSQTDLAFTLKTLDGRVFDEILRPSRPGFLVPRPPTFSNLAAEGTAAGLRRILAEFTLWLLLLTAALRGERVRNLALAAGAFAAAYALGQWLAGSGWLEVAVSARNVLVLTSIAVPAAGLAVSGQGWRGWIRPLWPFALLLGGLYGGSAPEALPSIGLSSTEQLLFITLHAIGIGLGIFLVGVIAGEVVCIVRLIRAGRWQHRLESMLGTAISGLATGMLFTVLTSFLVMPEEFLRRPSKSPCLPPSWDSA